MQITKLTITSGMHMTHNILPETLTGVLIYTCQYTSAPNVSPQKMRRRYRCGCLCRQLVSKQFSVCVCLSKYSPIIFIAIL